MLTLHTKDPDRTGNAIIVREIAPTESTLVEYFQGRKLWLVETDFGNRMKLTDQEIDEMFIRANHVDYQHWLNERTERRMANYLEDRNIKLPTA